ncbi:Adenine deaminase [Tolypocladium ophioglossoides CBS 100239]|uniref:Adenine deaminase n=1 Tax=Tolypocladium ophioglossoides (strain CBS 100239) TaxID=1163406 RepID=A0A0L0N8R9_TOLOC|nr:Adenine deaminase [Tolypocladium ophioglossoides CBS 100239]
MCNDKLHHFLHALPKCEHHVHIEGTISPELLFSLAAKNSISLPQDDPAFGSVSALEARYKVFTSLDDFLHYYFISMSCLITASDFEDLTYNYLSHAHGQNVHHAEIFFDPQPHMSRGVSYQTIIAGMDAARMRAAVDLPKLSIEFIPCLVRHLPVPAAHDMLAEVISSGHFADGTLAGFGMSSTEIAKHPSLYTSVYETAKAAGITNLTAHYGEEGPAEYVRDALSLLSVRRIDHGRRSAEDPDLVRKLAETSTMLTLCPISNVVLKGVERVQDLPIREFLDAGVLFSINSDDPAYFGGYILENYCAVQEAFGFTMNEWETIATRSIRGSWCSVERKEALLYELNGVMKQWK